ncbi:hypothetical protein D1AOALGA4SA_10327 [Olavius algarvensis Delta 1 endosymbiont]|nr:hypothetical protein D1AOALGA4SA_10327 [Olavius algarvensis Delta 1 endosymbiont]
MNSPPNPDKLEIRNSKSEIRNKFEIQNSNVSNKSILARYSNQATKMLLLSQIILNACMSLLCKYVEKFFALFTQN